MVSIRKTEVISSLSAEPLDEAYGVRVDALERPLLVASTGGHLAELHLWARKWGLLGVGAKWVTFESEQSQSLLENEDVHFIPYVAPRDLVGTLRSIALISHVASLYRPGVIVSTGSAIAVSCALVGLLKKTRSVYIESLARFTDLSLTAKILARFPKIEKYVQNPQLEGGGFEFGGTVLDGFDVIREGHGSTTPQKVFVTLGTIQPYKFDRLVDLLSGLLAGKEVTWQIGAHTKAPTFGRVHRLMTKTEFSNAILDADVVVSHAGVGTILDCLSMGKLPIVIPRLSRYGEHVDDHQVQIAQVLSTRGLVIYPPTGTPSELDLVRASRAVVMSARRPHRSQLLDELVLMERSNA